jgi:catechol 2,3-dioxygenase-like lactoylglutathione lyase family enzyme
MGEICGLAEIVLSVRDVQQSAAFYRDLLGFEVISPPELPAVFLRVGGAREGAPHQIVLVPRPADAPPAEQRPPRRNLHHMGLEIAAESLQTERERIEKQGIPTRTGVHPFLPVEAFYLDDPDGNEVEIVAWTG